ncbi:hypothetical protein A5707_16410 [Mycobacterium kyorinense]|uniref:Uncharacterized protein n=1 Tax=Mycobacterium kyorinense TaxID=487514 RepID=A0A1A2ZL36_9MYCO|nr:hypothetical protein A5707_16410 [Mycobacterium kyorinense]
MRADENISQLPYPIERDVDVAAARFILNGLRDPIVMGRWFSKGEGVVHSRDRFEHCCPLKTSNVKRLALDVFDD